MNPKFAFASMLLSLGQDPQAQVLPGGGDPAGGNEGDL
jgi:hypothetical protein